MLLPYDSQCNYLAFFCYLTIVSVSVVAVCHGDDWCGGQILYSMQPHPSFYMSADSGDIFLVNNDGSGSVQETCDQPCQLHMFADHAYLDLQQASLTVQVFIIITLVLIAYNRQHSRSQP